MFNEGLVVGKFFPLHNGHVFLIEEAAKQSKNLTVVVTAGQTQTITLKQRVDWLNKIFPQPEITIVGMWDDLYDDYNDPNVWSGHEQIFNTALRGRQVDAVFSSEQYGYELAERFNAVHVPVDVERKKFPISGTKVRANLFEEWNFLPPVVKNDLGIRIVIVGAESTGTTTLSQDLTDHYRNTIPHVGWVGEYGRELTHIKIAQLQETKPDATVFDLVWDEEDFRIIGEKQTEMENDYFASDNSSPLIICDTDAFATTLWEDRYLENGARTLGRGYAQNLPQRTLYIVTDHVGVDFFQDGIRDGEHIRADMTEWFKNDLTDRGVPWIILRGTRKERLKQAAKVIDRLVAKETTFVL